MNSSATTGDHLLPGEWWTGV